MPYENVSQILVFLEFFMYLRLGLVEVGGVVVSVILWLVGKDLHSDHGLSVSLGRSELNLPIRISLLRGSLESSVIFSFVIKALQ